MSQAITIDLAKIEYDLGEPHLKIMASTPSGYEFIQLIVTVYTLDGENHTYDISTIIGGEVNIAVDLPISSLSGVSGPAIYEIQIGADEQYGKPLTGAAIYDRMYLSDVHAIYRDVMNGIMDCDPCNKLSDDIIKKYLMLYGHQSAIQSGDLDVAKEFFMLMHKNFTKCGNKTRTVNCCCNDKH